MLTTDQATALRNDILNSTDPDVVAARGGGQVGRNDTELTRLYNLDAVPVVKAWRVDMVGGDLFQAMNITKFDTLTAGKRSAWELMLEYAPIDFGRQKYRKAVTDVWGAADAAGVLADCQENASRAEVLFGGTEVIESGVTGLKRGWYGDLTTDDVGRAMNAA